MVFVILGTQKQSFKRLLEEVQNSRLLKNEEIIAQNGYTNFESDRIKMIPFMDKNEFEDYIDKADLIITHGGVGSIFSAIVKNKKIIAMPRLKKHKEHINDHQTEICKRLFKLGYITYFNPDESKNDDVPVTLDMKINYAKTTDFYKYIKDDSYLKKIEDTIDLLLLEKDTKTKDNISKNNIH